MGDGAHVEVGDNSVWLVLFTSLCGAWKLNPGHQTYAASVFTHWAGSLVPGFYQMNTNLSHLFTISVPPRENSKQSERQCLECKMGWHADTSDHKGQKAQNSIFILCFLPHDFSQQRKASDLTPLPLFLVHLLSFFCVHIFPLLHLPITFKRL